MTEVEAVQAAGGVARREEFGAARGNESNAVRKATKGLARIATTLLFDLKVYGKHHIPASGGAIIASNHLSYLDPVVLGVQLRQPVSFLAKSELFSQRWFGWYLRKLHAFPVRQGAGDVSAMKECIRRVQEGHVLTIYPEGTRSEDGGPSPIQGGVALVVRRAGVPVVPAIIRGTFEAWPGTRKMFKPWPVRILYGAPMRLAGLKGDQITGVIDSTFSRLRAELEALCAGE